MPLPDRNRVSFTLTGTKHATPSKGLARQIRERTENLSEQLSEAIRISLDPNHKDQFKSIQWLAERAYGRVPEISAFADLDQAEASAAISALNAAQLETLVNALQQVRPGLSTGSQAGASSELSASNDSALERVTR